MTDRTVADAKLQQLVCERCGEAVPIPLGTVQWVTDVMQAFIKAHRTCKPGDQHHTYFAEPPTEE